ncbi:MAG: hypothetical protein ACREO9_07045, partial [Lysobacterales bacterium]
MKRFTAMAVVAVAVLFATQVSAEDWGWVTAFPNAEPGESVFTVNIENVDGTQPVEGAANVPLKPGAHEVKTSLVANAAWLDALNMN